MLYIKKNSKNKTENAYCGIRSTIISKSSRDWSFVPELSHVTMRLGLTLFMVAIGDKHWSGRGLKELWGYASQSTNNNLKDKDTFRNFNEKGYSSIWKTLDWHMKRHDNWTDSNKINETARRSIARNSTKLNSLLC